MISRRFFGLFGIRNSVGFSEKHARTEDYSGHAKLPRPDSLATVASSTTREF
jgi:hypothetical protein